MTSNIAMNVALQNLPIDLHLSIIYYLEPMDIIALGQTCKYLREAATQRSVWLDALNEVCNENGTFAPTYSPDLMSISELRRASTGPSRMISKYNLCQSKNETIDEVTRGVIPDVMPAYDATFRNFAKYLFLVPGGRFLVTYDGHPNRARLCVWDLKDAMKANEASSLKPLIEWKFYLLMPIVCSQTPNGTGLRIAAVGQPFSDHPASNLRRLLIFEYHPTLSPPKALVYKTGDRIPEPGLAKLFITGDILVQIQGNDILMWNFVRNLWIGWEVSLSDRDEIKTAFFRRGHVILVCSRLIGFWKFSDHDSWVPLKNIKLDTLVPQFTLIIDEPNAPEEMLEFDIGGPRIIRNHSSWYDGRPVDTPFVFIAIWFMDNEEYYSVTYEISPPCDDSEANLVKSSLSGLHHRIEREMFHSSIAWEEWRMVDGQSAKCFSNGGSIQLRIRGDKVSNSTNSYCDPVLEMVFNSLSIPHLLQKGRFSFDPVSGRLCYADSLGSVVILDFMES